MIFSYKGSCIENSYFLVYVFILYTYVHDQWESIPFYLPGEKQRDLYLDDLRMYV